VGTVGIDWCIRDSFEIDIFGEFDEEVCYVGHD
jgi:hypothetical protein